MLNHGLQWDKWVLMNLSHYVDRSLTHLFLGRTSHAWLHIRGVTIRMSKLATRLAALRLYHCRRDVRDNDYECDRTWNKIPLIKNKNNWSLEKVWSCSSCLLVECAKFAPHAMVSVGVVFFDGNGRMTQSWRKNPIPLGRGASRMFIMGLMLRMENFFLVF